MLRFCRVFAFEQGRRHPSIQDIIDAQAGCERAILAAGVNDLADMGECPPEGGLKAEGIFVGRSSGKCTMRSVPLMAICRFMSSSISKAATKALPVVRSLVRGRFGKMIMFWPGSRLNCLPSHRVSDRPATETMTCQPYESVTVA